MTSQGPNEEGGWGGDDWDTSDLGSIEQTAKNPPQKGASSSSKGAENCGEIAGDWDNDDWGSIDNVPSTEPKLKSAPKKEPQTAEAGDWGESNWNTDDWGSLDANTTGGLSKAELAKKKREERKQQRLQAMKEKKAAGRGPAKLGGVKIQ